jgi:hypothetical protein
MSNSNQNSNLPVEQNPVDIANQAFMYGLPLVLVDITKEQNLQKGCAINAFKNISEFCDSSDKFVVRPNCDTFYSSAFFDLTGGPLLMTIPVTGIQYYMMPLLDAFTNVIDGSPGTRTGQTQGGQYLLVGSVGIPNGTDTSGYTIIKCPTDMVWAIGRFQVNNPDLTDEEINGGGYVESLQNQLSITPLSGNKPLSDSNYSYSNGTPNEIVASMTISDFFNRLNVLLVNNPPTKEDDIAMTQFATIGVGTGLTFDETIFSSDIQEDMNAIPVQITNQLDGIAATLTDTKWSINLNPKMGDYGVHYKLREGVAYNGLGANLVADAAYYGTYCYGSDENNLLSCNDGQRYALNLNPLPPQNAFWSLTMYDQDGFFVSNVMNRYGLGHDSEYPLTLVDNGDGTQSTTIEIYYDPNSEDNNNWLPAPATGNFNVMIRVYWPDPSVIDEKNPSWIPPAVERVS